MSWSRSTNGAALETRRAAKVVRTLHQHHLGAPDQVPVPRQGSKSHRARVAFIELTSELLRKHTGRATLGKGLLAVIADLAEIAIPAPRKPVDPESIARRQRRKKPRT